MNKIFEELNFKDEQRNEVNEEELDVNTGVKIQYF